MSYKQSFQSLMKGEPQVLILGSIPGDRSLEMQQYYGHPQNRFWRVIASICGSYAPTDYDSKKRLAAENRIALWDVAHRAIRAGSLDSAIRDEEPNAINDFLMQHPSVKVVAFNGKKAEQLYNRYFVKLQHIKYISLPSTSPANAACRYEQLCEKWSCIFE